MSDFASRRMMMVDTQVRPSDVTKFPIIEAMLNVEREAFVPAALREAAYVGLNVDLAPGRVVLDPRTQAKMLDALDIQPDELVLDVAPGLGYSSALVARLAQMVIAVEADSALAADATRILAEQGIDNVVVVEAALAAGAPAHAPYDVILIEGGVEDVPAELLAQLREGGRIAAIFQEGALGTVKVGLKADGRVNWRFAFNAAAPVLPGFARAAAFAL